MQVGVNGTRLWFDVDGAALVPEGPAMRERPTVVLLHGGPGSYESTRCREAPVSSKLSRRPVISRGKTCPIGTGR